MSARKTLPVAEKDALKRAAFPILLKQHNIEIFGHGQSPVKHPNIDIFGSGRGIENTPKTSFYRGNVLCPFHAERAPVPKPI